MRIFAITGGEPCMVEAPMHPPLQHQPPAQTLWLHCGSVEEAQVLQSVLEAGGSQVTVTELQGASSLQGAPFVHAGCVSCMWFDVQGCGWLTGDEHYREAFLDAHPTALDALCTLVRRS